MFVCILDDLSVWPAVQFVSRRTNSTGRTFGLDHRLRLVEVYGLDVLRIGAHIRPVDVQFRADKTLVNACTGTV